MTREYARVRLSIWADSDFRLLSDAAQALYFRLLSSPTTNLCGVADWRPNRLAALTADMTPQRVREVAWELTERGYIVTDEETEEVLIRSFVRHDGLIKTPNIAASMAKDYAGVASRILRGVIIHELRRLYDEDPGMKGWATASKLLSEHRIDPSEIPSVMASGMASANPSGMASDTPYPNGSGNGSHIPQPSAINPHPASPTDEAAQSADNTKRGKRLPKDWIPSEASRRLMLEERPDIDLAAEHRKFTDHWTAKTGRDATKLDWDATWRNWIRNARVTPQARPSPGTHDFSAAMARAAARDAQKEISA